MPELDRRNFLKLVGASAGAAAAAGCSDHVEKLIPYVVQPEEITPGNPVCYASTCRECPVGCGLHVKTREGRPIKLEGNPEHPVNRGRLCAHGQAAIGRSYSPDRFPGPMKRNAAGALEPSAGTRRSRRSPRRSARARRALRARRRGRADAREPAARPLRPTAVGVGGARGVRAVRARGAARGRRAPLFGVASLPVFDLTGADLVLDFGSEFLESGPSPTEHAAPARRRARRREARRRRRAAGLRELAALAHPAPTTGCAASRAARASWRSPSRASPSRRGRRPRPTTACSRRALAGFGAEEAAKAGDVPAAATRRLGKALAKAKAPSRFRRARPREPPRGRRRRGRAAPEPRRGRGRARRHRAAGDAGALPRRATATCSPSSRR